MTKTEQEIKDYIGRYDNGERMLMVGTHKETGEHIVCVWDYWEEDMAYSIVDKETAQEIAGKVEKEERITIALDKAFVGQKYATIGFETYNYAWLMCKRIELISDATSSDVIISLPNGEECGYFWTFEPSDVELWRNGIKEFEAGHGFRVYQKTGIKAWRFDGGWDDSIEMDGDGFKTVTADEWDLTNKDIAKKWDFDFLDCEGDWRVCIEYYPPRDDVSDSLGLHEVKTWCVTREMYKGDEN